jgi:hypothetical protein
MLKYILLFLLLQTEKPDRRHTFASLALRKRYSYLTDPAASEFNIFTFINPQFIQNINNVIQLHMQCTILPL